MTVFPDAAAETYDTRIETLVPGYNLALSLMTSAFKTALKDNSHILVAGCGTGSEYWNWQNIFPVPILPLLSRRLGC